MSATDTQKAAAIKAAVEIAKEAARGGCSLPKVLTSILDATYKKIIELMEQQDA